MGREIALRRETVVGQGTRKPRADLTTALKALQLAVSVGILALLVLIYPGILAIAAGAVAFCYVLAALFAARDRLMAIWLAFAFGLLTFAFSGWGVYRYFDNGFDWFSGNFPGRVGIHWPAFLFLLVAVGSLTVIVLHVRSWRWMIRPREHSRHLAR